jgi:hypothetical protein
MSCRTNLPGNGRALECSIVWREYNRGDAVCYTSDDRCSARPLTLRIVSTCVWAPFTTSTIQDKMMDFRKWFFFHGLSFTVKLNIWSPGKRPFAAIDVVAVPHNASILRDSSLARKITETPLYMQQVDVRHSGSEASNWDEPEQTPESNFYRHKTKAIYENKWSNKIKFS